VYILDKERNLRGKKVKDYKEGYSTLVPPNWVMRC
jgi:hypothetical protein